MNEYEIFQVPAWDQSTLSQVDRLLLREGIIRDANLDYIAAMTDENGEVIATGSCFGQTLRCFAVSSEHQGEGLLNQMVSHLMEVQLSRGNSHLFLYTKVKAAKFFESLGFYEIARVDGTLVFMENRRNGFPGYLKALEKTARPGRSAAIVMNANPFTNGHRYLVEQTAKENDLVYVFVVNTDLSLFKTSERFELVKAGTADLKNVIVVDGGDYMVSYATFPAYFLESADQTIRYQTTLDARVFRDTIAPALNIKTRYVGSEPLSRTTGIYNQVLQQELPPKVALKIIDRKTATNGNYITATEIRKCIKDDNLDAIVGLVPATTQKFVEDHVAILQERIKEGMNINGN